MPNPPSTVLPTVSYDPPGAPSSPLPLGSASSTPVAPSGVAAPKPGTPPPPSAAAMTPIERVYPQGDPGLSAYQIAVLNGFVGTEAEWLQSLLPTNDFITQRAVRFDGAFALTVGQRNQALANLGMTVNSSASSVTLLIAGGALGTPASGTLSNCTGLPVAGLAGVATNIPAFLLAPTPTNLRLAMTSSTGTGNPVFAEAPTINNPQFGGTAAFTGSARPTTSATGTPAANSLISRDDAMLEQFLSISNIWRNLAPPQLATGGTGGASISGSYRWIGLGSGTTGSSWARAGIASGVNTVPAASGAGIDFSTPLGVAMVVFVNVTVFTDVGNIFRIRFGSDGTPTPDGTDPVNYRSFGLEFKARGTSWDWRAYAHNGTSITYGAWLNSGGGSNLLRDRWHMSVFSDGLGSVTARVGRSRGNLVAQTIPGGPQGNGGATHAIVEAHVANSTTGTSAMNANILDHIFYTP